MYELLSFGMYFMLKGYLRLRITVFCKKVVYTDIRNMGTR